MLKKVLICFFKANDLKYTPYNPELEMTRKKTCKEIFFT